ncbi:MAG: hypothetical protein QXR19_01430 [Candidatus Jordarchaeaceae archaeon]
MFNATSETVTPLFFRFLDENPRYKEAFKLYDQVLAQENDYKMQELTKAIVAMDVNYVVQNGELLNQWNITTEINGTTYTSMFKEYSLDVNGTTQTVVKVTIMSSDGPVIVDPYLYVHKFDLFYLTFVIISWWPFYGIYVPCYYGWDIYSYIRYSNNPADAGYSESALFLAKAKSDLDEKSVTLTAVAWFLASTAGALASTVAGAPASAVLTVVATILGGADFAFQEVANIILREYLYAATYNSVRDPLWGICTMERYHIVYTTNPVEYWSWTNFHVAYCDGGVKQISPFPSGIYHMSWNEALTIVNFFAWVNSYCGFEHWVWLGPYVILE